MAIPELAFIYDFDGTLLPGNTMDQGLLPDLGFTAAEQIAAFWQQINQLAQDNQADRVCIYMHELARLARATGQPLTKPRLRALGKKLKLHKHLSGKNNWFTRLAKYCGKGGLRARHYVVSSGLEEIIDGCPVAHNFHRVFASRYLYNDHGEATWPAVTINYTNKTQFLFRISKGKLDMDDDTGPNEYMPSTQRPVPFERMVFIGDGETDIPCFSLVRQHRGHAIAILNGSVHAAALRTIEKLVGDNRVDSVSLGDHYAPNGSAEVQVRRVIDNISQTL